MVRNGEHDNLEEWLSEAGSSLLASLARGLNADKHAVLAALRKAWSNGQTEGQINKLKPSSARCMDAPTSTCCEHASSPLHDETSSKVSQTRILTPRIKESIRVSAPISVESVRRMTSPRRPPRSERERRSLQQAPPAQGRLRRLVAHLQHFGPPPGLVHKPGCTTSMGVDQLPSLFNARLDTCISILRTFGIRPGERALGLSRRVGRRLRVQCGP